MLIQMATRFGWSAPQEVLDSCAVQLLQSGAARAVVVQKIETTALSFVKETAAKLFGRKG